MKDKVSFLLKILFAYVLIFCFVHIGYAENDFELIIKLSEESHLEDGMIWYGPMGINSSQEPWGTNKFIMSVDGGKTWTYAYCLNNDLYTPYGLLNKEIKNFDKAYNYENIKKILYYGYGGPGFDSKGYEYVRKNSYYIWMPTYDSDGNFNGWVENWTDDLAYVLTHLALSYAYYHDVIELPEEEAEEKAFYGVFESENFTGTKARSVAKLWYEYLIEQDSLGINLSSDNYKSINPYNSSIDNPLTIDLKEKLKVGGVSYNELKKGRIEFEVPLGMICEVTGENEGTTKPGVYGEHTKIILGANQNFNLSLDRIVNSLDTLEMNIYEDFNVTRVDGGTDEEGNPYQSIVGLYTSQEQPQVLGVQFKKSVAQLHLNKKIIMAGKKYKISNTYYFGIFNQDDTLYDIIQIKMNDEAEKNETFYIPYDGKELKYYIKETDKNGNPLQNSDDLKISIDKTNLIFNEDNLEESVNIVNDYKEIISPDTGNNKIILTLLISFISFVLFAMINLKYYNNISRYDK